MPDSVLFPYLSVRNALGETAWRPVLPLRLVYGEQSIQTAGLVDTGADVNVLPYQIGLELGLVWDDEGRKIELSGNLAAYDSRAIILTAHVEPFTLSVRLAFAWTRAEHVPLLLGQANFLKVFNVCFFGLRQEFELRLRSVS